MNPRGEQLIVKTSAGEWCGSVKSKGLPCRVAANLCVDTSTVHRIVKQFEALGTVGKKPY